MEGVLEKQKTAFNAMKADFAYSNVMQAPKITKVVVSVGIGSAKDKEKIKVIESRLMRITGQKAAPRVAKKAIAAFKTRQGMTIGYQVTLRGERMYDFLNRLIHIALPRTRDFRGLSAKAIDDMGNYTLGIRENTIFPETSDEDLKDVFGLAITIVTTAKTKKEAETLLRHIGMPLQK
jgi:large subunit ribosomal protein L5